MIVAWYARCWMTYDWCLIDDVPVVLFQTDLFGLAGTIHVLLHSQYMKVYQEAGAWKVTSSYNRSVMLPCTGDRQYLAYYQTKMTLFSLIRLFFSWLNKKATIYWLEYDFFALRGLNSSLYFQDPEVKNLPCDICIQKDVLLIMCSVYRGWNSELWKKLFTALLNVPSCSELPDLADLRHEFEQYFVTELLHKYNRLCPMYNKIVKGS